jgi:hypothetical protein
MQSHGSRNWWAQGGDPTDAAGSRFADPGRRIRYCQWLLNRIARLVKSASTRAA